MAIFRYRCYFFNWDFFFFKWQYHKKIIKPELPTTITTAGTLSSSPALVDASPNEKTKVLDPLDVEFHEHPTCPEIVETISSLTPFQKIGFEKNFLGLKVKWKVEFRVVHRVKDGIASLICSGGGGEGVPAAVTMNVNLSYYPRFKTMKAKEKFWIYGEIIDMDVHGYTFELDVKQIIFIN